MILSNEQLEQIQSKYDSWLEVVGTKVKDEIDRRKGVSEEMIKLIEEVGLMHNGTFSPDQLCKSVEIQKKVHNLNAIGLPRFLGYLNYSRFFKGFTGSVEDFIKEHPKLDGGIGYPGVDLKEFSTTLQQLLTSKGNDFAKALESIYSFEGVGLAVCSGYLYLWDPQNFPLINNAAINGINNITKITTKQKKQGIQRGKELLGINVLKPSKIRKYLTWFAVFHEIEDKTNINSFHELDWFLWNIVSDKQKFWQIAPGEKARLWDDLLDDSIAAVGYSQLNIDLSKKSKGELLDLYKKHYPDDAEKQIETKFGMLWNFITLKPGDKFVTNKGKKLLLGIGKVKGRYKFRPEREEYKHTIDVDYFK
ncbi:MAG: hypothetical protein U9R60_17010, partial [Bacteroidota bacterium]|nr:hypothetical protein [Bacteroidota bacterium]